MHRLWIAKKRPIGFAFEIADLMRLEKWAKVHNVRMVVELDHYVEEEENEEVIAFYAKDSPIRRWILWRSASEVVVQRLIPTIKAVTEAGIGVLGPARGDLTRLGHDRMGAQLGEHPRELGVVGEAAGERGQQGGV